MEHIVPISAKPDIDEMIQLLQSLQKDQIDFVAGIIAGIQFTQKTA